MKKNPNSKGGLFNPRLVLPFFLCLAGVLLAMWGLAAPPAPQAAVATLKPVVRTPVVYGVTPAVRDLPKTAPAGPREIENGLLRVRPGRPVPAGFVDPVAQTALAPLAAPTPSANFEGQSANDSGCGCIPPDPNGAVGPNQYVQMVNSVFSVYSKTGTRLTGPTQINTLFSGLAGTACADNNNGDPVVVYDRIADRWILSQFAVPGGAVGYHQCIAVSQTPDATGQYYAYDFLLSTTKFEDYPHLGLWPDAYYMMTHQFDPSSNAYVGAGVFAFERAKMLAGQSAQMLYFDLGPVNMAFGGHLPASLDGANPPPAGAPGLFAEVDSATDIPPNAALRIWKFHVDWTTPSNSTFGLNGTGQPNTITPVADFARPNCDYTAYEMGCVPQLGDAFQLDPIGDRLMHRAAYRNFGDHEAIVLNHTVVSDSTTGQMGPRWYEVRDPGGTPTIFQQSTWGPTGMTDLLYRWMGSIAMDASGDIAIGYSTSSQANFPSIAYAGRLAGDPLNTLAQGEVQLFAGGGPEHGELFAPQFGRWGDYTALQIDPTDDCTFWYTNEYFAATDAPTGIWHTRIGSFKFPQCVPPVPPQLVSVVSEKTHGTAGTFDITLFNASALCGPGGCPRGVECRSGGTGEAAGQFTMIFTFSTPLTSCGSTSNGALVSGPGANQCTVNLSRVTNATYVTVTLNGVVSSTGGVGNNFTGTMGVLLGDVNGSGRVDAADVSSVRQNTLQTLTTSNFQNDINTSGRIDAADVSIARQQTLTSLPTPP